jgi:hypothetical protein
MASTFCFAYTDDQIQSNIGLSREVFIYLYNTYCGYDTVIDHPSKLWELFVFYKQYPTRRAFLTTYDRGHGFYSTYHIAMYEAFLADRINELDRAWRNRFRSENRLPHIFDANVTGCIDTFCDFCYFFLFLAFCSFFLLFLLSLFLNYFYFSDSGDL